MPLLPALAVRTTRIERAFINPSLTWRPSLDTSLTIIANYQRDPYSGYYGALPGKGTLFPSNFGIANGPLGRLPRDFYDGDPNIVEVYIAYLRKRIDAPFGIASIQTIRGAGYRLIAL